METVETLSDNDEKIELKRMTAKLRKKKVWGNEGVTKGDVKGVRNKEAKGRLRKGGVTLTKAATHKNTKLPSEGNIMDSVETLSQTEQQALKSWAKRLIKMSKVQRFRAIEDEFADDLKNDPSGDNKTVLADLRSTTKQFLQTCQGYLNCRAQMDAKYKEVDEFQLIANFSVIGPHPGGNAYGFGPENQQESVEGLKVKNLVELYDSANRILPVYKQFVHDLVRKVNISFNEDSEEGDIQVIFAPLKGRERAQEKAEDDYSNRTPGPAVSWLYDIVRGSILFKSADQVTKCLELLLNGERSDWHGYIYRIIKVKNRFAAPTLTGYRDLNIHVKLDSGKGFGFICEIQIHHKAIKVLDKEMGSHMYYESFRSYFAGATESLEERLEDLKIIMGKRDQIGEEDTPLDKSTLLSLVDNCKDAERVERLADLFHHQLCEYEWALHALRKAVDIHTENGDDESAVPKLWNRMGTILEAQGNTERAMAAYRDSWLKNRRLFGLDHPEVAASGMNLAGAFAALGRFDMAMLFYKRSLEIWKANDGEDDLNIATVYNNMATIVMDQDGKLDEAMFLFEKSLRIYENSLGEEHPVVSKIYNNMAMVLDGKGELDESIAMYHKVLDLGKRNHGEDHTDMATAYANLAHALGKKGDVDQAISLYERALDITIQNLGKEHPSVASLNRCISELKSTLSDQEYSSYDDDD